MRPPRSTQPRRARLSRPPRLLFLPRLPRRGILPLGTVKKDWNFSLQDKRVLNFENEVSDDDNIKQDASIDVYGRNKE